ncbi:MAG: flavodoxin-dependent (E)-4-hydroxy-3-methylbut-2-enyl-diphosphate synthase, partial [Janthinobacterium lividum]
YVKRETYEANAFIGGSMVPRVVLDLSAKNLKDPAIIADAGYLYSPLLDKYNMADQSVDFVYLADELPSFAFPGNLKQLYNYKTWRFLTDKKNCHPVFSLEEYHISTQKDTALNLVRIKTSDLETEAFHQLTFDETLVFVLETDQNHGMADQRECFFYLQKNGLDVPVIVRRSYRFQLPVTGCELSVQSSQPSAISHQPLVGSRPELITHNSQLTTELQLYAATDFGALLVDGFGDGIWIDAPEIPSKIITSTAFGILQATRSRISKTEYISCPSCGRTLFDLQITTQMIRSRTSHLKGLKIAIMGCIVNGPGEMADADYGYVGAGPDKITLYRGKEVVKKNVSALLALDELIRIIKVDGNWVEPEVG